MLVLWVYHTYMKEVQTELFNKAKKKKVNITITPEIWDAFEIRSDSLQISRSTLIEIMIKQFLEENQQLRLMK